MNDRDIRETVLHNVGRAMGAFSMLRPGDRIAVGVSGGKDSMCLVHALQDYRARPILLRTGCGNRRAGKIHVAD